ncbi:MAG: TlyA family rRNA (cytidine-2'-O)-methyltransferase, partial [bacterium]|nr:TlyA family rRNA (cytidine-2'-O)-methyltransferase [bacterium]
FEAGKRAVAKGRGVIRDSAIHVDIITRTLQLAGNLGWSLCGLTYSPITGPEGNMEFIAWWKISEDSGIAVDVATLVEQAHVAFKP